MTRINLVPPQELSDQHLIAEYHELPRCIKQKIDISDASDKYILGKGHMKWAKKHTVFLLIRFSDLWVEMLFRGFHPRHTPHSLILYAMENTHSQEWYTYTPTYMDIELSRNRLIERYNKNPSFYRWTNRKKPNYYGDNNE